MTTITATELKENLGKYLALAQTEDIEITKNGKPIARLATSQSREATKPIKSIRELFGILPKDGMTLEEARDMRLREKCEY